MTTAATNHHHRRAGLRLVVHQCRFDLRAFRRNRQAMVTTVVMPVVLLFAFVALAGHHAAFVQGGRRVSVARFYVPGLIAFAVAASAFASLLLDVVTLRQAGILKRRRATPVPAAALIGGRTLSCCVVVLGTTAALLWIGRQTYDVHVTAAAAAAIAVTTVIGTAAFCSVAYAIAPFVRGVGAAQPVIQLVLLPLYIMSGVLLPDSKNPELLRQVARVFPLAPIADGLHRALAVGAPGIGMTGADLALLAAWTLGGLLFALRRFEWLPR